MTGATSAVPPGDNLTQVLASALHGNALLGDANSHAVVMEVLDALLSPPISDELVRVIAQLQSRADIAFSERDDLYDSFDGPEPRARLCLQAIRHAFKRDVDDDDAGLTPDEAQEILDDIDYKPGWRFEVSRLPAGSVGVQVVGAFDDVRRPGRVFTARRRAWDHGSLLRNALAAAEALEIHEARERFKYRGDAIFNEHRERADDPVPAQRDDVGGRLFDENPSALS